MSVSAKNQTQANVYQCQTQQDQVQLGCYYLFVSLKNADSNCVWKYKDNANVLGDLCSKFQLVNRMQRPNHMEVRHPNSQQMFSA